MVKHFASFTKLSTICLKGLIKQVNLPFEYKRAEHRFITAAGNIKIYQLQMPHRIVGSEYTYCGIDEFDVESWKNCDMAFKKAIGRMRGCDDTELYIVTSPEGYSRTGRLITHYTHHN